MFKAVLVVLYLSPSGIVEGPRIQYSSPEECERAKYQREFTERAPSEYLGVVFLCEWN